MEEIWIVDDAVFMRAILHNIVDRNFGFKTRQFNDGLEALNAYKEAYKNNEKVALILMDITMPNMDGITALGEIMKINHKQNVVMCSSLNSQQIVIQAIRTGAKHFISKPFSEDNVVDICDRFLTIVEYDENGYVLDMNDYTFFRLIKARNLEDIKGYIRSGYDLNSTYQEKSLADAVIESEDKNVYNLIMSYEDRLSVKNRNILKGIRLREITNLKWDGQAKEHIEI